MCPSVIIQEFYSNMHGFDYSITQFVTHIRGIHMVVTSDIVSEVLHVPRAAHPDYPSSKRLRTVSKDELASLFCETLSWGDRQNTSCSTFAKGPRILNMVMIFVLHPLFHYNTITEPCARLLNPSMCYSGCFWDTGRYSLLSLSFLTKFFSNDSVVLFLLLSPLFIVLF